MVFQTAFLTQATFYYFDPVTTEFARIVMRVYKSRPATEWVLKLGSIPLSKVGQEVVIQFYTPDIDNNKTFYTDSQGLEMQKRILDYRPTWNFTTNLTATQNYYPINSAIAIKDVANGNQLTLMSTRAQGGSSLKKGTVELMHNRRLFFDDWRGVGEALNETDEYGNGMQVTTTYFLQIFNSSSEPSAQRQWQLHVDEPIQYYF